MRVEAEGARTAQRAELNQVISIEGWSETRSRARFGQQVEPPHADNRVGAQADPDTTLEQRGERGITMTVSPV
jgi:hypothetical protein